MTTHFEHLCVALLLAILPAACSASQSRATASPFSASEVIDLGAVITEDLPQHFWGKAFMKQMAFTRQNTFEVMKWSVPLKDGTLAGSNAYYTLFNHGGPHVDAPNHMSEGGGLDDYPVDVFFGPVKAFDVSAYGFGRSIPASVFRGNVSPGDVVLILTKYVPPQTDEALPAVKALSNDAAEFLASVPVRAVGTDAFSIDAVEDLSLPNVHHSFLSRRIPIYEQLLNVDKLLRRQNMYFVGVPLNIKGGDGIVVRPVVFVY